MTCRITVTPLNGDDTEEYVGKTFMACVMSMLEDFAICESSGWFMWAFMPAIAEFSRLIYEGEDEGAYRHHDMSGDSFDVTFRLGDDE